MTKRAVTAALMLVGLFSLSRLNIRNTEEKNERATNKNLCEQKSPVNPFFDMDYTNGRNVTPAIDELFISRTIVGTQSQCQVVARCIQKIRESDPEISTYIDLAYTHIEGFVIILYPLQKLLDEEGLGAAYSPMDKALVLPDVIDNLDHLSHTIRHEFRHAAMHAVQLTLGKQNTTSPACYFPDNPEEQNKTLKLLRIGDNRIKALNAILNKEAKGEDVSAEDTNMLHDCREKTRDIYLKHYVSNFKFATNVEAFNKVTIGNGYNFDKYLAESYGNILIQDVEINDSETIITFTYEDPLHALVKHMEEQHQLLSERYPLVEYIRERDAYMHGSIPQYLIKYFYRELFENISLLTKKAAATPVTSKKHIFEGENLEDRFFIDKLTRLKNPQLFDAKNVNFHMRCVTQAIDRGHLAEAKVGLNTLIQKGFLVGEANLLLAHIANVEKDYKAAVNHYKRADKKQIALTENDRLLYSKALSKIGMHKDAQKQSKKSRVNHIETSHSAPHPSPRPY
jgi:hypothetical protein